METWSTAVHMTAWGCISECRMHSRAAAGPGRTTWHCALTSPEAAWLLATRFRDGGTAACQWASVFGGEEDPCQGRCDLSKVKTEAEQPAVNRVRVHTARPMGRQSHTHGPLGWQLAAAAALLGGVGHIAFSQAAESGDQVDLVRGAQIIDRTAPRFQFVLQEMLAEPIEGLALLNARIELGELQDFESRRRALYAQTLAAFARPDSQIAMVYAGLQDGQFLGYYSMSSFTVRPPGDAPATSCSWSPFDLATVNEQCAAAPECTPGPTVNATSAGLRTFHSTSREVGGSPGALTKWNEYDPRGRPWYTEALARPSAEQLGWSDVYNFASSGNLGVSATSPIRDTQQPAGAAAAAVGVFAFDFELRGVSQILADGLTDNSEWAYLVERNGDHAGKVIGVSSRESLLVACDQSANPACSGLERLRAVSSISPFVAASAAYLQAGGWSEVSFWESGIDEGGGRYQAVAVQVDAFTLDWLLVVGQNTSCPAGEIWTGSCEPCGAGTMPSLDDHHCDACPLTTAGDRGHCEQCKDGEEPSDGHRACNRCGKNAYSRYSNVSYGSTSPRTEVCVSCPDPIAEEPNSNHTACGCREGYENFGRLLQYHPSIPSGLTPNKCEPCASVFPKNNVLCPPGPTMDEQPNVLRLRAAKGWWVSDLAFDDDQEDISWSNFRLLAEDRQSDVDLSLDHFLYPCPDESCVGEGSDTGCREGMSGILCAVCVNPTDIKVDGECMSQCPNGYLVYWAKQLGTILIMSALLRINSGTLNVHIAGATIAHLTFFVQTLFLLGKFGENNMFGFARIDGFKQLLGEGNAGAGAQCGFRLSIYIELLVVAFVKPFLVGAASLAMFHMDTVKSSASTTDDYKPNDSKNPVALRLQEARAAQELVYLRDDVIDTHMDEKTQALWKLCCEETDKKLKRIGKVRIFLEVLMFNYMPVTTECFMLLLCRSVSATGQEHTLSLADLSVSCSSGQHIAARVVAGLVFFAYSFGFPIALLTAERGQSIKFDAYARVAGIFVPEYNGWMSFLMWRRAFLVLCYTYSSSNGGLLYLPSQGAVDFRMLPFVMLASYVAIQAHAKPYFLPSDNALEQVVLLVLMLVIFADMNLGQQVSLDYQNIQLKHPIIFVFASATVCLVFVHKRLNANTAKLAKVGLIVTKKVFIPDQQVSFFQMVKQAVCCTGGDDSDDSEDKDDDNDGDKKLIDKASTETGVNPSLTSQYLAAFRLIDADASGFVDLKELATILRMCGESDEDTSDVEVEKRMAEHDTDGNGLDFIEMMTLLVSRQHEKEIRTEIMEGFLVLADRTDPQQLAITKESLRAHVTTDEADKIMAAMVGEGDGDEVDQEQFTTVLLQANPLGRVPAALRRAVQESGGAEESEDMENPLENPAAKGIVASVAGFAGLDDS